MTVTLIHGDCLDILPTLEAGSVDAVVTDPPYPEIKRAYGKLTVPEWWDLMMGVCSETRRILKPTGSAVFILQPNSERVGQMRGWLWEFMAWVCREWNMVQDTWWWNSSMLPTIAASMHGLMRQSVKACVWCGPPSCYRDQDAVLWTESYEYTKEKASRRISRQQGRVSTPSKHSMNYRRIMAAADRRGGVTPFNILPIPNSSSAGTASARGHGAGTPLKLADWWTRYICPPGGTVLDMFMGSGTMGIAAIQNGCDFVGIEKFPVAERDINDKDNPDYYRIAKERIEKAQAEMVQEEMAI